MTMASETPTSPLEQERFETAVSKVVLYLEEGAELRKIVARACGANIVRAAFEVVRCLKEGGKILFFGNGGSAADAQHLAAEFVGRFLIERRGLPAVALTTDSSILTAVGNDYGFDQIFARQIQALGNEGDVAVGVSTGGNSPNVLLGIEEAKRKGLMTIGLAGRDGGKLAKYAEIAIVVPSPEAAKIQECHIAIGHLLCGLAEADVTGSTAQATANSSMMSKLRR